MTAGRIALALVAVAVACSPATPETRPVTEAAPAAVTAACRIWATAVVERRAQCGVLRGSVAQLEARARDEALRCARDLATLGPAAATRLSACADALGKGASCDTRCDLGVRGALAPGAPCGRDEQCRSGSCGGLDANGCGTCAATAAPATCACGAGETCDESAKACIPLRPEGAFCAGDAVCAAGLYCARGRCAEQGGEGAACAGLSDCGATFACEKSACVPVRAVGAGEACAPPSVVCRIGACNAGKCPPAGAKGAACTPDGASPCDEGLACARGKCAPIALACAARD